MITTRDRPIDEVQTAILKTLDASEEVLSRTRRKRTTDDAVLPIPQNTLSEVVFADGTDRKARIVKTLDGNPNKGTVVVAIRGTDDLTDLALDRVVFTNPKKNLLKPSPEYQEIKNHVEESLRLLFSDNPVQPRGYKKNWDVFAVGHSLGGAVTDQLILDGVVTGGLSFAAPRTIDSKFTQPSYGIINIRDGVVGRVHGLQDTPFDLVVPGVSYLQASALTQHNMPFLKPSITATLVDEYPKFNNKKYRPSVPEKDYNLTTGSGRAPKLHTLYDAAVNAYDHGAESYEQKLKDFIEQGLMLPELTLRRFGKAIVHFYVYSTPKYNYLEMPIRAQIEQAIRKVAKGENLDDIKLAMLLNNF